MDQTACNFTKSNTPPWVFSRFSNCTNGTESRKASHIKISDLLGALQYSCNTLIKS